MQGSIRSRPRQGAPVSARKYAPGDRVVRTKWPAGKPGVIVKIAMVSALVRWDNSAIEERCILTELRPETAEDICWREYVHRLELWRSVLPVTKLISVAVSGRWGSDSSDEIGAQMRVVRTPAEMRAAAEELMEFAAWFEAKPVKPNT